jgi:hypothetical protein
MRMKFIHPAILTGNYADGRPRAELCRVESEFEVPEYTWADAPVTFVTQESGVSRYHHSVGDSLFKAIPGALQPSFLETTDGLSYILHNGQPTNVQFEAFYETVSRAAAKMEDDSGYALKVDVRRNPLNREVKRGMREVTKACLSAPMLRNWSWLSPAAEAEVEAWRAIAAEKIANLVMIRGVPALRSFEPCLVLTKRFGIAQVQAASKHVYARQVHISETDRDGMPMLGPDAFTLRNHYFAADDYDGAVAFAREIGWTDIRPGDSPIRVRIADKVTDDYEDRETLRHAQMALAAAAKAPKASVRHAASVLADEVRDIQKSGRDLSSVRRELSTLSGLIECLEHIPALSRADGNINVTADLKAQLRQGIARSDRADVTLEIPMTAGFGR